MPAAMRPRTYTLAAARALLPQVKALMAQAQAARKSLVAHEPALWAVLRSAATNGGSAEASAALPAFNALETSLKAILELGIVVQDVDTGLVDFVGLRDGQPVYLCWQHGEDDIAFWHEMDEGFAGRHPLDDRIA
jgi:hypothetical protein